jgi:mannose-6-phosphate isomerase-like protein (cupin superfamily)
MITEATATAEHEELENLDTIYTYKEWQATEGIPVVTGFYVEDLATLELAPYPRRGGRGAFVNLEGTGGVNDMHVLEITPGGALNPERHMYEAMAYVIGGRGSTAVWYDGARKQTFEWGPGSLFAIPLNANYQLFNGSGAQPARLVLVTNAPTIMNLFHNDDFIFNNPFVFADRFSDEEGYFSGDGKLYRKNRNRIWETNFVPDVRTIVLHEWKERGAGGRNVLFELARNSMAAHVSQFPVGTYKKAHRHGPGAHVVILTGIGFSTLWQEAQQPTRVNWKVNSVVVPPSNWFHQHFNTGPEPARYLALKFSGRRFFLSDQFRQEGADVSVALGGCQLEYEDENRKVHRTFEAELAENGAQCGMRGLVQWCTADEGPRTKDD